ncbi:MAG TPA: hypothetical protein VHX17_11730 [Candidatus Cybelea sp.]|jgi:hypothetical protein|nr:hypothetical protein [Candidatus Cybelea sp.]
MPLQNRVTPYGEVEALPGRGLMMGNRGILHDESRRVVRSFAVKRWIACVLEFRGRKRTVMAPHRYTELFFLDEAAGLSAGHRPCAECRRADYNRFRDFWEQSIATPNDADSMDLRLHADRLDGKRKRTYRAPLATLPDGAYVVWERRPHLVWGNSLLEWSDEGYKERTKRARRGEVEVLTPRAIVEVLAAGYRPTIHPSAG